MKRKEITAILAALTAALCYSINIPFSKILLSAAEPCMLSGFLYLGAGVFTGSIHLLERKENKKEHDRLTVKDLPYVISMIVLDIAAPILLMLGLRDTSASVSTLINNFEIVSTSLIASFFFHEAISKRGWLSVGLITLSTIILSFSFDKKLTFSPSTLLVILAAVAWGFENNCTRMLSTKDTSQIVFIKGIFSGMGSLIVALLSSETFPELKYILYVLALGALSYGLSLMLYIKAQSVLGAGRTSSFYAVNPFLGAVLSFFILDETLSPSYATALVIMLAGTIILVRDTIETGKYN